MTDLENRMAKGPWIRIARPEEATGDLKRAYERIGASRGRIPEIRSVMAGEPGVVEWPASIPRTTTPAPRSTGASLN
jgi:hypothetical protein